MSKSRPETFKGDFINGSFRKAKQYDGSIKRQNPSDLEELIGEFFFRKDSVNEAIEAAKKASVSWAKQSWASRRSAVLSLQSDIKKNAEHLAQLISREVGKPLWESKAEVQAMISKCETTIRISEEEQKHLATQGNTRFRLRPLGVVAVLGQSTFPGHLSNTHLIPALLSGNTIVFKPSEVTPATGQLLAEIFSSVPKGVINVIQGDPSIGELLAAHPGLNGVFLTGTYQTGRKITQATLDQPWKLLALQMGGKCGCIVDADADIKSAALESVFSSYVTTGQRCTATSRIFLHKKIAEAFLEKFTLLTKGLRIGNPFDADVFMGPMISMEARERYLATLQEGTANGAERLFGGDAIERSRDGAYVRPSAHRMKREAAPSRYTQEELFGPDVAIYSFSDLEEAIEQANQNEYGLAVSYFGKKESNFEEVLQSVKAGVIHWNRGTISASGDLPFGGIGKSGNFRPSGAWSLRYSTFPVSTQSGPFLSDPQKWPPGFGRDGR
jgi:succinylglutamic semialdehyde dehydrogenase